MQAGEALAEVAGASARSGDLNRAQVLVGLAEAATRAIAGPGEQVQALTEVAGAAARAGDLNRARALVDWAEAVARTITGPGEQVQALTEVAGAAVALVAGTRPVC